MVHTFKIGGHRIAYDSVSGYVLPLSELTFKMLDYITLPMPAECSSALRYDLAKYDSAEIREEYSRIYELYRDGKLFAEDEEENHEYDGAVIMLGDTVINSGGPDLVETVERLAAGNKDCTLRIRTAHSGEGAFSANDLPKLEKALVELAKLQLRRGRTDGEAPVKVFTKLEAAEHTDDKCKFCWAKRLCSESEPHNVICELEKKRIECRMITDSEA